MKLKDLLAGIECNIFGEEQIEIEGIAYDSRKVQKGYLFFCIKGYQSDGHQYAKSACEAGAVCLVVTQRQDLPVTQVVVKDDRAAMALISAAFYGHPAEKLRMVGVTGTSGKTSTTYLLKSIFEHEGSKVGLMGTIVNVIGDQVIPAERTTPEAPDLQKLLADMLRAGIDTVVMEVSSHSLYLKRVYGIRFQGAIFTNLTQDHLDFHGDFEHYRDAKAILFANAEYSAVNADDPYGEAMIAAAAGQVQTYGIQKKANVAAKGIELGSAGSRFIMAKEGTQLPILLQTPGMFSVYNALAAITVSFMLGVDMISIKQGIEAVAAVPGRFERLDTRGGDYSIILDYAHKPDSLESTLKTARGFSKGRLVCIFGCGGNRDAGKRPMMGGIAERLADFVIVTSDNPRFEQPGAIIEQILAGMKKENHIVVEDRRSAIHYALEHAQKGDVIILAGKGHEDYQEICGQHFPFDEKVIVAQILDELGR